MKMTAADLDGTLPRTDRSISARTFQALEKL